MTCKNKGVLNHYSWTANQIKSAIYKQQLYRDDADRQQTYNNMLELVQVIEQNTGTTTPNNDDTSTNYQSYHFFKQGIAKIGKVTIPCNGPDMLVV